MSILEAGPRTSHYHQRSEEVNLDDRFYLQSIKLYSSSGSYTDIIVYEVEYLISKHYISLINTDRSQTLKTGIDLDCWSLLN